MTAPSSDEVERVYQYLVEYITTKKYPPLGTEIIQAIGWNTSKIAFDERRRRMNTALETLKQAGKIQFGRPRSGVRLDIRLATLPTQEHQEAAAAATNIPARLRPTGLTVDSTINWQRMLKEFRGVVVSKLTAGHIARYYRKRCRETDPRQAECEANVLLCLRFPEAFLEQRHKLALEGFGDRQRSKRGCRSCGAKFRKIRPNQLYCSARCRAREKRHRRQATPRGKLLKSRQNRQYRLKYQECERERRRQWRESHPEQYRAQRSREGVRRRIGSKWNKRKYQGVPPALAGILNATALG